MRIAVLCNDRLGIPALQQLSQSGLLKAVGTSDRSQEMMAVVQQITTQARIPSQIFTRATFESDLLNWLDQHKPDVVIVKTFPYRIPASALNIPKHGFINFHYAPLPQYRGPNPLFWMIRNGITSGGVTVHRMDEKFDCGPILFQHEFPLQENNTFGTLCSQLAMVGASVLPTVLQGLLSNNFQPQVQDDTKAKWWGRPKPADLMISWKEMSQEEILALIRACNPWNRGAATRIGQWTFAISDASPGTESTIEVPGTILEIHETGGLTIACRDGKTIRAEVIYTEEGIFSAGKIILMGIQQGALLE